MDDEFSRLREVCLVGEGTDREERFPASNDFSGDDDGSFEGDWSMEDVTGAGGGGADVKKLTAKAGFSRMINRNRKSSFRFSGRPALRNSTSLVFIKERNMLCEHGKSFNR